MGEVRWGGAKKQAVALGDYKWCFSVYRKVYSLVRSRNISPLRALLRLNSLSLFILKMLF